MIRYDFLAYAKFETIQVGRGNEQIIERFFHRNNIPYMWVCREEENDIYAVRAGIDYIDSMIFVLKMRGDLEAVETINEINTLVHDHEFHEPKHEYEFYPFSRVDEQILGTYV